MRTITVLSLLVFGVLCSGLSEASPALGEGVSSWPGFRGQGNSITLDEKLPLKWSEQEGVAWRAPLEGFGQSSPVTWGEQVYVTSTGGESKEHLFLECFHLISGKRLWRQQIEASEKVEKVTKMISQGAPTPVAGPLGVYCFFESGDLVAFDHEGKEQWSRKLTKEFGKFEGGHGVGSSLVGAPERLLLLIDHDGPSYLLCVDRKTGKTVWKAERESRVSWTTPLYLDRGEEAQVVISSNGALEGYDLKDGKRIWWLENITRNTVASPSSDGNIVVIGSSSPRQCLAVKLGGEGDIAKTHIAWRAESATSSFSSPLLHRGVVYFINRAGTLQAQTISDGKQRWEYRLPDGCWASPVAAGERIYFFCKNGKAVVLAAEGDQPQILSENSIRVAEDDKVYGFAVAGNRFVLRVGRELIAVGP
ncbi:MAG: PQQ-binding-like beta-propeller repeat protein [Roseibacillus sp.]|nr:PQQ-binding-like beta-propeller repeat protein [Roseibacillus sp.]